MICSYVVDLIYTRFSLVSSFFINSNTQEHYVVQLLFAVADLDGHRMSYGRWLLRGTFRVSPSSAETRCDRPSWRSRALFRWYVRYAASARRVLLLPTGRRKKKRNKHGTYYVCQAHWHRFTDSFSQRILWPAYGPHDMSAPRFEAPEASDAPLVTQRVGWSSLPIFLLAE
jgi:hypothetical protein